MECTKETTYSTEFEGFKIEVLWIEYDGGGMCYEYRISRDGSILIETEDGWGSAAGAASGAFKWINEEGDAHTGKQDHAEPDRKIVERGPYKIIETPDQWIITHAGRDERNIGRWTNETITTTDIRFSGGLYLLDVVLKVYEAARNG